MNKSIYSFGKRFLAAALILVTLFDVMAMAAPLQAEAATVTSKSISSYRVDTSKFYEVSSKTAKVKTSTKWYAGTFATLDKGAIVQVSGTSGDFYKVVMNNVTYYIKKADLKKAPSGVNAALYYTTKNAPLRNGPTEASGKITTLTKGQVITVVGGLKNDYNNRWLVVAYQGKICYLYTGNAKQASKISLRVTGGDTVGVNKTIQLSGTTSPSGLKVTWSTSNSGIATVDSTGRVKGVYPGIVKITAKIDQIVSVTYQVNVDLRLNVKAVRQTTQYTCSAAASLAVLRYKNTAKNVSDTTLYKKTQGYVYLVRNTLNSYLGSGTYKYGTFTSYAAYEKAVINSLKQDSPVIARVKFSKQYFNYKSGGHYTTITGVYMDSNGTMWACLVDSFVHNYAKNSYTDPAAGTVRIPLKPLYNYGSYGGTSAIYLIYNP